MLFVLVGVPGYSQVPNEYLRKLTSNASQQVRHFYSTNSFSLAWTNRTAIDQLVTSIRTIGNDGLNPEDYNLSLLEQSIGDVRDEQSRAIVDIYLTDAFLTLAHDLYQGRLDPDQLFAGDWDACTQPADYAGLLADALDRSSVCETLDFLRPMDNAYEGLKYMLSGFREIQVKGEFPEITVGNDIRPGDIDERVASIRTRFRILNLIPDGLDNESIVYDSVLMYAVQKFQYLHSLSEDAVIGRRTQQALSLRAEDYIDMIVVNLERYRWLQSRMMDRSVRINIPTAALTLTDHEKVEWKMKVIVGRTDRRTPVLSSVFNLITINPTWTVPPTILKEDVLPAIAADPGYLERHHMRVINIHDVELNPDSVPWSTYKVRRFPYTIREDAGPHNPLGLIKFSFPNDHSVYLHDTNMPSLFSNLDRMLSSGCIRIASPMTLARFLTGGSGLTEEMIREQITSGETKTILLRNNVPIHITYLTASVINGEMIVARDVYQYDRVVLNALLNSCKSRL